MLDIPALMAELAKRRLVFHSEADFQHELAWLIQQTHPGAKIRLEKPIKVKKRGRARLDIWVDIDSMVDAIELKYQTRKLAFEIGGEEFDLANKGAEDSLGYDFVSDLVRVERLAEMYPSCTGHAILLSNEDLWKPFTKAGKFNKDAFRIHDGRELSGSLSWRDSAKAKERAAVLELSGDYKAEWQNYSNLPPKYGEFRYLWLCTGPGFSKSITELGEEG